MFAEITSHGIVAENGVSFELLGPAPAWGLSEKYTYAVREAGAVKGKVLPAVTRGWPYRDSEIEILAGEYTYREIIKAKADFLAHVALYGDDIAVKAAMHDLSMFAKKCRGVMSLSRVFED